MSDARTPGRSLFSFPKDDPLLDDGWTQSTTSSNQGKRIRTRVRSKQGDSREHVVTLASGRQHRALDAINARLDQGWCLNAVRSSITSTGQRVVTILLQRKRPQSLFDFAR